MLEKLLVTFGSGSAALALWGPFFLLLLCGVGLPIPEDIILFAAGFAGHENDIPFLLTSLVMYLGIVIGDSVIYGVGHHYGRKIVNTRWGRAILTPERYQKAQSLFKKYGTGVVLVARFLPGLRAPVFLTSGTIGYSFWRFLLLDGLAALVSAPIFVWLGYWGAERFGEDIYELQKNLGETKIYVVVGALVVCLGVFIFLRLKHKREGSRT